MMTLLRYVSNVEGERDALELAHARAKRLELAAPIVAPQHNDFVAAIGLGRSRDGMRAVARPHRHDAPCGR